MLKGPASAPVTIVKNRLSQPAFGPASRSHATAPV